MQHKNTDLVLLLRGIIAAAISPSSEFHPFSLPFFGDLPTKKINIRKLTLYNESFRHELRENVRSSPSREGMALFWLIPIFYLVAGIWPSKLEYFEISSLLAWGLKMGRYRGELKGQSEVLQRNRRWFFQLAWICSKRKLKSLSKEIFNKKKTKNLKISNYFLNKFLVEFWSAF